MADRPGPADRRRDPRAHRCHRRRAQGGAPGGRGPALSPASIEAYRTPDERFEGLPDFDFEPRYREHGGLRLAHIDTGEGPPVVFLHGEPAWSFIWRKVIGPVRDAGYRCIAADHVGFGRSDKPVDSEWQSLERHAQVTGSLLEDLDLSDATLVVHDWGGPIGMTAALEHSDRVSRMVILDTVIDFREGWMSESWVRFREFVESTDDIPAGELMRATFYRDPGEEVIAAYDAPFPAVAAKAALRGLPMSVPRAGDRRALAAAKGFERALREDQRPKLMIWGEADLFLPLATGERLAASIGRTLDHVLPETGHAVPEDQGERLGSLIVDWLATGP